MDESVVFEEERFETDDDEVAGINNRSHASVSVVSEDRKRTSHRSRKDTRISVYDSETDEGEESKTKTVEEYSDTAEYETEVEVGSSDTGNENDNEILWNTVVPADGGRMRSKEKRFATYTFRGILERDRDDLAVHIIILFHDEVNERDVGFSVDCTSCRIHREGTRRRGETGPAGWRTFLKVGSLVSLKFNFQVDVTPVLLWRPSVSGAVATMRSAERFYGPYVYSLELARNGRVVSARVRAAVRGDSAGTSRRVKCLLERTDGPRRMGAGVEGKKCRFDEEVELCEMEENQEIPLLLRIEYYQEMLWSVCPPSHTSPTFSHDHNWDSYRYRLRAAGAGPKEARVWVDVSFIGEAPARPVPCILERVDCQPSMVYRLTWHPEDGAGDGVLCTVGESVELKFRLKVDAANSLTWSFDLGKNEFTTSRWQYGDGFRYRLQCVRRASLLFTKLLVKFDDDRSSEPFGYSVEWSDASGQRSSAFTWGPLERENELCQVGNEDNITMTLRCSISKVPAQQRAESPQAFDDMPLVLPPAQPLLVSPPQTQQRILVAATPPETSTVRHANSDEDVVYGYRTEGPEDYLHYCVVAGVEQKAAGKKAAPEFARAFPTEAQPTAGSLYLPRAAPFLAGKPEALRALPFRVKNLATTPCHPGRRERHASVVCGENLYVHGGVDKNNIWCDHHVWALNLKTMQWKQLKTIGLSKDVVWSSHTASLFGSTVVLFGGMSHSVDVVNGRVVSHSVRTSGDCILLDLPSKHATCVDAQSLRLSSVAGVPVVKVRDHAACVVKSRLYVFGGRTCNSVISRALHVLDLQKMKWVLHYLPEEESRRVSVAHIFDDEEFDPGYERDHEQDTYQLSPAAEHATVNKALPGVHSDAGGRYSPGALSQGRSSLASRASRSRSAQPAAPLRPDVRTLPKGPEGCWPSAVHGHSLVSLDSDAEDGLLLLFGGKNNDEDECNTLYAAQGRAGSVEWFRPRVAGAPPSPRWGHGAALVQKARGVGLMIVTGGSTGYATYTLSTFILSIPDWTWTEVDMQSSPTAGVGGLLEGAPLQGRQFMSCAWVSPEDSEVEDAEGALHPRGQICLYGGRTTAESNATGAPLYAVSAETTVISLFAAPEGEPHEESPQELHAAPTKRRRPQSARTPMRFAKNGWSMEGAFETTHFPAHSQPLTARTKLRVELDAITRRLTDTRARQDRMDQLRARFVPEKPTKKLPPDAVEKIVQRMENNIKLHKEHLERLIHERTAQKPGRKLNVDEIDDANQRMYYKARDHSKEAKQILYTKYAAAAPSQKHDLSSEAMSITRLYYEEQDKRKKSRKLKLEKYLTPEKPTPRMTDEQRALLTLRLYSTD